MQIHSASAYELIDDAYRLGEHRPLILAGGAKAIYEPWDFFGLGPESAGADVVVTGEEFVILELLDRLLDSGPREICGRRSTACPRGPSTTFPAWSTAATRARGRYAG